MTLPISAAVGGCVWLAGVAVRLPDPFAVVWSHALLLLAALVLVPLGLALVEAPARRVGRCAAWLHLPAAGCLAGSYCLSQGALAAALALPWLLFAAFPAMDCLLRLRQRWRRPAADWALDFAVFFLVVGAGWAVLDRLGERPLDFEPVIVLLTAIHFHYAGFTLALLAGLAARARPGLLGGLSCLGVIAGVPLVAVGITAAQLGFGWQVEAAAAWFLAAAGALVGLQHLRLAMWNGVRPSVRLGWGVAGVSLLFSMALACLYGGRWFLSVPWLDIPWMRALHGSANALGCGVVGLAAWWGGGAFTCSAEEGGR